MSKPPKGNDRRTYADVDPKLTKQTFVAKFEEPALWAECNRKCREFWIQHGHSRNPPQHYRDPDRNKIGWWFPEKWRQYFEATPRKPEKPPKPERSLAERAAYVERVVLPALQKLDGANRISPKEAELWRLPTGTQITSKDVIYPDGMRESVDAIRLRALTQGPAPSAEQENLEAMLRQRRAWMDKPPTVEDAAEMSPELKRVLQRNWHVMGGPAPKADEEA